MIKAKTGKEVKNYYENRYGKEKEEAMRPDLAYQKILQYLELKKEKKLLDVGCGTGQFLKAVTDAGIIGYGIDFSAEAIKIAKKLSPKAKILQGQVEKIPFPDKSFDYIVSIGCLQYFPDMKKALNEIKRVAKNNCQFLFMMPNTDFLLWKIKGKNPNVLWGIEKNLFPKKGWLEFLEKNGFIVKNNYRDLWFSQRIQILEDKNLFKILLRLSTKIIWNLLPSNFSYQHIFLCSLKNKSHPYEI